MTRASRRRFVPLAVLALGSVACAPKRGDDYQRSVAEARRAYHAGRFDEAASRYDEAGKTAAVPRDAVFARYEAALARARAGDRARAGAELRAIADAKPPNAYSAEAAFKAAELAIDSGDEDRGYAELERVTMTFPSAGVARVAIVRVARHADTIAGGPAGGIARLDAVLPHVTGTEVEQTVVFERAKRIADAGRTKEARDLFVGIADRWPYPRGPFFDDSLYRASELEEQLGNVPEAIAHLERLVSFREKSGFMGSYERPKYVPAILRIADLYEQKLNDRAKARDTLHRLYSDFRTSIHRDDALWREAELWRKDGDTSTACDRLATLVSDFPDSRYVPCAAVRCPGATRPKKSKAPATCHEYLLRDEKSERAD